MRKRWLVDQQSNWVDHNFAIDDEIMAFVRENRPYRKWLPYRAWFYEMSEHGLYDLLGKPREFESLSDAKAWCEQMVVHAIAEAICRG